MGDIKCVAPANIRKLRDWQRTRQGQEGKFKISDLYWANRTRKVCVGEDHYCCIISM